MRKKDKRHKLKNRKHRRGNKGYGKRNSSNVIYMLEKIFVCGGRYELIIKI